MTTTAIVDIHAVGEDILAVVVFSFDSLFEIVSAEEEAYRVHAAYSIHWKTF